MYGNGAYMLFQMYLHRACKILKVSAAMAKRAASYPGTVAVTQRSCRSASHRFCVEFGGRMLKLMECVRTIPQASFVKLSADARVCDQKRSFQQAHCTREALFDPGPVQQERPGHSRAYPRD